MGTHQPADGALMELRACADAWCVRMVRSGEPEDGSDVVDATEHEASRKSPATNSLPDDPSLEVEDVSERESPSDLPSTDDRDQPGGGLDI